MSKGLEFPYVFLLGSETDYTKSGGPKLPIKLDKKLGFAIKTINEKNHTIDDNPLTLFLDRRADLREKEERMRLLYVALTRAKHGLYIYATVKDSGSNAFFKFGEVYDNTYFSFMSRSISRLGYETVEAKDLDCESTAKPQRVWGKGDEKWVNALTNVFAAHSTAKSGERVKTSVTALSAEAAQESARSFDPERKTGDEAGDILTRTGTAYHKCMELIDFDKPFEENAKGLNSETIIDFDLVDLSKIETCYNAVLPLTKGAKVYKEKQFIATRGKTLVQGVIDLLIVRDGKATVVDYKNSQARHLVKGDPSYAQYERQVGIYAEAVKNILGLEVEKVALYSFKSGEFITFD
jgi:ATP-dependent exoDNAse (exonuclease V) beta subunit